MPHGFPLGHPRWFANTAIPNLIIWICILGFVAHFRPWPRIGRAFQWFVASLWLGGSLTFLVVFPHSAVPMFVGPLVIGVILFRSTLRVAKTQTDRAASLKFIAGIIGTLASAGLVVSQIAPKPDTRPMNAPFPDQPDKLLAINGSSLGFRDSVTIFPYEGEVEVQVEDVTLMIQPQLRLISGSPDRFWSSLAPRGWNDQFDLRPIGMNHREESVELWYDGVPTSVIELLQSSNTITEITAFSKLSEPVYTHLNSFCRIVVNGHKKLSLAFSPCPAQPIDVLPSDYPMGRPVRLAYVDEQKMFHVVEATSGEKGPFVPLALGSSPELGPLYITLVDDGRAVCRIGFLDWSTQIGTQLSPTAGWGLPVNSIEFSRSGEHESDSAVIYQSLASSSVGRGWDTVGHSAGVYRNRIVVERLGN